MSDVSPWPSLAVFIHAYQYGKKPSSWTGWLLLTPDHPIGDCEDFAWTVLVILEGSTEGAKKSLRQGRAKLYFIDSPAGDETPHHTVLWHINHGFIDSREPEWQMGIDRDGWLHAFGVIPIPKLPSGWVKAPAHWDVWFSWGPLVLLFVAWGAAYKARYGNTATPRKGVAA